MHVYEGVYHSVSVSCDGLVALLCHDTTLLIYLQPESDHLIKAIVIDKSSCVKFSPTCNAAGRQEVFVLSWRRNLEVTSLYKIVV